MRKQDEMEKSITLKAIRTSWIFTAVVLFTWGVVNYVKGMGQTLPMILFVLQVLVVLILQQVYFIKIGDKDSKKNLNIMMLIIFAIIVSGVILLVFSKKV